MLSSTEWTYRYQKRCIQPCHGHFTAMPKRPKMCRSSSSSSSSLSHFLFPRDFSGTITDRDITINTPLEPLRPVDMPFGGFVDIAPHFGGEIPRKPQFWGVNRCFQAKRAKYWKFHVIETPSSISTKFCTTMETIKWSSRVVPISAQQIQDGGRPPFFKNR